MTYGDDIKYTHDDDCGSMSERAEGRCLPGLKIDDSVRERWYEKRTNLAGPRALTQRG